MANHKHCLTLALETSTLLYSLTILLSLFSVYTSATRTNRHVKKSRKVQRVRVIFSRGTCRSPYSLRLVNRVWLLLISGQRFFHNSNSSAEFKIELLEFFYYKENPPLGSQLRCLAPRFVNFLLWVTPVVPGESLVSIAPQVPTPISTSQACKMWLGMGLLWIIPVFSYWLPLSPQADLEAYLCLNSPTLPASDTCSSCSLVCLVCNSCPAGTMYDYTLWCNSASVTCVLKHLSSAGSESQSRQLTKNNQVLPVSVIWVEGPICHASLTVYRSQILDVDLHSFSLSHYLIIRVSCQNEDNRVYQFRCLVPGPS